MASVFSIFTLLGYNCKYWPIKQPLIFFCCQGHYSCSENRTGINLRSLYKSYRFVKTRDIVNIPDRPGWSRRSRVNRMRFHFPNARQISPMVGDRSFQQVFMSGESCQSPRCRLGNPGRRDNFRSFAGLAFVGSLTSATPETERCKQKNARTPIC